MTRLTRSFRLIVIPAFLLFFFGCGQKTANVPVRSHPGFVSRLQSLLEQKEFFRLETKLKSTGDSLSPSDRLFFQVQVDNAFNRNDSAIAGIQQLLDDTSNPLPDSARANLLLLLADGYFKTFRYARAARADSLLLARFGKMLDSNRMQDLQNHLLIYNALRDIPPQEIVIPDSSSLHWTRDRIGLIEIPLSSSGHSYPAIFDTRANISSVSESFARKLGLKRLNVSYTEGSGITGLEFRTGLGVADSIALGKIKLRHVVFQIMPDSVLYIAPIHFALNILIGYPVIEQLREIHIFSNGHMDFPAKPVARPWHNLALDHLDPVIFLRTDKDTLCFHFDLGASSSQLYNRYFEKYKLEILRQGHPKMVEFGGAGGIEKKSVYVMPSVNFFLGNRKAVLENVDILTEKISPGEMFYGNIGQDFVRLFPELILNFKDMYVEGK